MRPLSGSLISIVALFCFSVEAGAGPRQLAVSEPEKAGAISQPEIQGTSAGYEMYRGYLIDLTQVAKRDDLATIEKALQDQINMVESVGLSQRVLEFFHKVPIVADEFACLDGSSEGVTDTKESLETKMPVQAVGCYHPSASGSLPGNYFGAAIWDNEKARWVRQDEVGHQSVDLSEYTNHGVVMIRPADLERNEQRPVLLHEMLHAYHAKIMPQGVNDPGIAFYYDHGKMLYPQDTPAVYLTKNQAEYFAVTASVFLHKEGDFGLTRSYIKQKQPDYYSYLVWLFGFDPDDAPKASPVAAVN